MGSAKAKVLHSFNPSQLWLLDVRLFCVLVLAGEPQHYCENGPEAPGKGICLAEGSTAHS